MRRSKHDILISCTKDGYEQATFYNNSGLSSAVGANIAVDVLLTAGLSSIIDSASGADNEYQEVVNITLRPKAGTASAASAPEPTPAAVTSIAPADEAVAADAPKGGMAPIANP